MPCTYPRSLLYSLYVSSISFICSRWTFVPTSAKGESGSGCGISSPMKMGIVRSVRCTSFSVARTP